MRFVQLADTSILDVFVGASVKRGARVQTAMDLVKEGFSQDFDHVVYGDVIMCGVTVDKTETYTPVAVIGSDEGHSVATLKRLCQFLADLAFFLGFGRSNQYQVELGKNLPTQLQLLHAVCICLYHRMGNDDLPLLLLGVELTKVIKTKGDRELETLDKLVFRAFEQRYKDSQHAVDCPSYSCLALGHRILMDTALKNSQIAEFAKYNSNYVDDFQCSRADLFLFQFVCTALFSVPAVKFEDLPTERILARAESKLHKFDISRWNVLKESAKRVIDGYIHHLLHEDGSSQARAEVVRIKNAFEDLVNYAKLMRNESRHTYHHMDHHVNAYVDKLFTVSFLCRFKSLHTGTMQFHWIPALADNITDERYPNGYGMGFLYFPCRGQTGAFRKAIAFNEYIIRSITFSIVGGRSPENPQERVPPAFQWDAVANEWLISPSFQFFSQWEPRQPADIQKVPGLVHCAFVNRRTNYAILSTFESQFDACQHADADGVMPEGMQEAAKGYSQLRIIVRRCISQAHQLQSEGYSEGLWGHAGFLFYFKLSYEMNCPPSAEEEENGQSTSWLLPPDVLDAAITQPYSVRDQLSSCAKDGSNNSERGPLGALAMGAPGKKNAGITELYGLFIGLMKPGEVVKSAQMLRRKMDFYEEMLRKSNYE